MSGRSRAAVGIWRAGRDRTAGDRAYVAYMILMIGLVTIVPIGRAVWLSAASPAGGALLGAAVAPGVAVLVVAVLWAGALLLGRDRGPALLPPFLLHTLASSDLRRSDTLRPPLLRAGLLVTGGTTLAGALVGASLADNGVADPLSAVLFAATGALVGLISTVAWLAGQSLPRTVVALLALGVLALGGVTWAVPVLWPFTPWGWVGLAYPGAASPHAVAASAAGALALVGLVPVLLNRLRLAELMAQAARWESATTHAASMDFSAAATVYQARPRRGRHLRAVRPGRGMASTFLLRDAIGAARTPGRLLAGILALGGGGVLLALAFAPAMPGWLLGAAAGVLVFAGLGPLTDGVRHAASVAADFPLYGISDERLLAHHSLFPLLVVMIVLPATAIVCALIVGVGAAAPIASSLAAGVLALLARIGAALKGPMPTALLTPIPTPMGDLAAATRMAWALDGVLLAAAAGSSAVLLLEAPVLAGAVAAVLIGVGVYRWRHRS